MGDSHPRHDAEPQADIGTIQSSAREIWPNCVGISLSMAARAQRFASEA